MRIKLGKKVNNKENDSHEHIWVYEYFHHFRSSQIGFFSFLNENFCVQQIKLQNQKKIVVHFFCDSRCSLVRHPMRRAKNKVNV